MKGIELPASQRILTPSISPKLEDLSLPDFKPERTKEGSKPEEEWLSIFSDRDDINARDVTSNSNQ